MSAPSAEELRDEEIAAEVEEELLVYLAAARLVLAQRAGMSNRGLLSRYLPGVLEAIGGDAEKYGAAIPLILSLAGGRKKKG